MGEGVAQREQGVAVFDNAEGFHGRCPHPLGGGVGGEKLRVLLLQPLEFPH
ncbi:hypothetical protein ES703_17768 [subsurface metagenome]